jgi:hypothetical protein
LKKPAFRVENSQHGLDVYRKHRPDVRFGALRMSGGTLGELLSALHYNMPEKRPDVSTLAGLTAEPGTVKHRRHSLRRDESGSQTVPLVTAAYGSGSTGDKRLLDIFRSVAVYD